MTKDNKLFYVWIAVGSFVTLAAGWQAQVTLTNSRGSRQSSISTPTKSRHSIRSVATTAINPASDYAARAAKGLTDRQIGWIVQDFKTAGLDLGIRMATREEYLKQRKAQDRWYCDALIDGLHLNPSQAAQMTAKLDELFDQAKADFNEALNAGPRPFQHNGTWYNITSTAPITRLIANYQEMPIYDETHPFIPGNLCTLPSELKHDFGPPRTSVKIDITFVIEQDEGAISSVNRIQDKGIDNRSPSERARSELGWVNILMPPLAEESPTGKGTLSSAKHDPLLLLISSLHPAQLKLLLLIHPELAVPLQRGLDHADP